MTPRQRILTALDCDLPDRVPSFEWFIDPTVGRALTGSADLLEIVERLDLDAVNIRPDYRRRALDEQTFVDEWAITRRRTGDCLPVTVASPIADLKAHRRYTFPDPQAPGRLASLERAMGRLGDRRAVVLNLRDGWSDMRELLGYENCLMALVSEPAAFGDLLERVVDYNLAVARVAVRRCGVQVVATTDDVATAHGLLMSRSVYEQVLAGPFRRVIAGFKDLGLKCIKHCDGDVRDVVDLWVEAGIDCLDPVDPAGGLSMAQMRRRFGRRLCLKGNIDCVDLLCRGRPQQVDLAVRQCIEQAGRAGLILSSSNTIHRGVRPENYRAMLEARQRYGRAGHHPRPGPDSPGLSTEQE